MFCTRKTGLCNLVFHCANSVVVQVYDVSGFIARHPGGVDQLMLGAGRDVTILFESYHHFSVNK